MHHPHHRHVGFGWSNEDEVGLKKKREIQVARVRLRNEMFGPGWLMSSQDTRHPEVSHWWDVGNGKTKTHKTVETLMSHGCVLRRGYLRIRTIAFHLFLVSLIEWMREVLRCRK